MAGDEILVLLLLSNRDFPVAAVGIERRPYGCVAEAVDTVVNPGRGYVYAMVAALSRL